jgi:FkbM family methyltransferase
MRLPAAMKHALQRMVESVFRRFGDRNPAFALLLRCEPQRKRIDIGWTPPLHRKAWFALKRSMVKVSSFDAPIIREVEFVRNGRVLFEAALDLTDYTQFRYYHRFPDPPLRDLILQGGSSFVDVGANVGVFTLLAATTFRSVYAFEPLPSVAELLRRNVRDARNVEVFPFALSNKGGEATLREHAVGSGGSTLLPIDASAARLTRKRNWRSFRVPVRRLDEVLPAGCAVDLLKIDVEGHECEVIEGARALIAARRPMLYVEIQDDARFRRICDMLPAGFRVFDPHRCAFSEDRGQFDTLFVWDHGLPTLRRAYGIA